MDKTSKLLFLILSVFTLDKLYGHQTKQYNDLNAPGQKHRIFDAMQGNWDVTLKIPIGNGKYIDGKTFCKAEWVMDGRFMRLEYDSTFQGKPLIVVRYLGFDRYKNKYTETHIESTHTDMMNSEGTISPDGKTITCWGIHVDVAINQSVKVRTVTNFVDNDTFVLEMIYTDPDGKDLKTLTLTHKKNRNTDKHRTTGANSVFKKWQLTSKFESMWNKFTFVPADSDEFQKLPLLKPANR